MLCRGSAYRGSAKENLTSRNLLRGHRFRQRAPNGDVAPVGRPCIPHPNPSINLPIRRMVQSAWNTVSRLLGHVCVTSGQMAGITCRPFALNVKYRAPGLESGPRESQRLEPMTSHSEGMIVYIRGPMLNNGRFPPNHA